MIFTSRSTHRSKWTRAFLRTNEMMTNWHSPLAAPAWEKIADAESYWQKKVERSRMTPNAGLLLGSDLASFLPVFLTPEILRTHMHVLGSTGVGKSFFLEAAIKSLILQGYGVALLDPHGDLYDRILNFCAWLSIQKPQLQLHRRVV